MTINTQIDTDNIARCIVLIMVYGSSIYLNSLAIFTLAVYLAYRAIKKVNDEESYSHIMIITTISSVLFMMNMSNTM